MASSADPKILENGDRCIGSGLRQVKVAFVEVKVYRCALYVDGAAAADALQPFAGRSHDALCADPAFYARFARAQFRKTLRLTFLRGVGSAKLQAGFRTPLLQRVSGPSAAAAAEALISAVPDVTEGQVLLFRFKADGRGLELSMEGQPPLTEVQSQECWLGIQNIYFDEKTELPAIRRGAVQGVPELLGAPTPGPRAESFMTAGSSFFGFLPNSAPAPSAGAGSEYELWLDLVSAHHLGQPEYRLGDLTRSLAHSNARLSRVYIECCLSGREVKTGHAQCLGDSGALFSGERMLFVYNHEPRLQLRVRDHRTVQALMRGDPLIGEASLELDAGLKDLALRCKELPLERDGEPAGFVKLRYRLQEAAPRA
mmetsp:Transcript_58017/g.179939  ORF Transcript_58017/g.179939 Transcript_58017/m.179939 type:complete len:370 (-) Transcript_58017:64-1173(-)